MLSRWPLWLRSPLIGLLLVLSTTLLTLSLLLPALLKLVLPLGAARTMCDRACISVASTWVAINNAWIGAASPVPWDVQGLEGLHRDGWYLVSPNHQSWVDILVLQRIFHRRIPFLKFFLKRELIWVPVIGLAWWGLDFPFMKRGRGAGARQADLQATRDACEKFKRMPTSVINFVEGTRFTPAKHARQSSPYRHLLKPKIGGIGIALATLGPQFEALLDVTLVYPQGRPSFGDLLRGQVGAVIVRVRQRPIPPDLLNGDPVDDAAYRARLAAWVEAQWRDKDALIDTLLAGSATPSETQRKIRP